MAKAGEAAENLRSRAVAAIENDPAVLSAMGGRVQVGNPISTSSMTSSINGRSTQQVSITNINDLACPLVLLIQQQSV